MKQIKLTKNYKCIVGLAPIPYFLSYSIAFDDGEAGWSGMGWSKEQLEVMFLKTGLNEESLLEEMVSVSDETFKLIVQIWNDERYKRYKDIFVPKDANMTYVKMAYKAYKDQLPLMVIFQDGWECYPDDDDACVSNDGKSHVLYIGKSNGNVPVLLHLEKKNSHGGVQFSFSGISDMRIVA